MRYRESGRCLALQTGALVCCAPGVYVARWVASSSLSDELKFYRGVCGKFLIQAKPCSLLVDLSVNICRI